MNVMNPYMQYQKNNTMSASPGELTLMLYDGCIKNIRMGREAIINTNHELANTSLQKAQAILEYLANTLDMRYELSSQLGDLYNFWTDEIVLANVDKDPQRLVPIVDMVVELRDTWQQAIRLNRKDGLTPMERELSQTGS